MTLLEIVGAVICLFPYAALAVIVVASKVAHFRELRRFRAAVFSDAAAGFRHDKQDDRAREFAAMAGRRWA